MPIVSGPDSSSASGPKEAAQSSPIPSSKGSLAAKADVLAKVHHVTVACCSKHGPPFGIVRRASIRIHSQGIAPYRVVHDHRTPTFYGLNKNFSYWPVGVAFP